MTSLFFIELKVCSFLERPGYVHSRHDEAEVLDNRFHVHVQCISESYVVVTPSSKKFGAKMVRRFT